MSAEEMMMIVLAFRIGYYLLEPLFGMDYTATMMPMPSLINIFVFATHLISQAKFLTIIITVIPVVDLQIYLTFCI